MTNSSILRWIIAAFACVCHGEAFLPLSLPAMGHQRHGGLALKSADNGPNNQFFGTSNEYDLRTEESACHVVRKPLARIFNGEREYLFKTERNIRDYEWKKNKDVRTLLDDLLSLDEEDEVNAAIYHRSSSTANNIHEFGMMIILPANLVESSPTKKDYGSHFYDLHDGQQRIITLCILLAALRDFLTACGRDYDVYVQEIERAIYPQKADFKDVCRVEVRGSGKKLLYHILSRRDEFGQKVRGSSIKLPNKNESKKLLEPEKLFSENYKYYKKRLKEMGPEASLRLWKNLQHRAFVLIAVPASVSIARSLVVAQSKGKNREPIDEFKALVCFHYIQEEKMQDQILNEWNSLQHEVGRATLESACLFFAQVFLRKQSRSNQTVELMEDFLKSFILDSKGQRTAADFFRNRIVPAAKTLRDLRKGKSIAGLDKGDEDVASTMRFLTKLGGHSKHIELLYFFVVKKFENSDFDLRNFKNVLKDLEKLGLWMLLVENKNSAIKAKRCFDCMAEAEATKGNFGSFALTKEEETQTFDALRSTHFEKSSGIKAKAILQRLNEHELLHASQGRVETAEGKLTLEHVLPQTYTSVPDWTYCWDDERATEWMHRLGNLALLNQKANGSASNKSFEDKRFKLKASPYPLTSRIGSYKTWNLESVEKNHDHILELARQVWNL